MSAEPPKISEEVWKYLLNVQLRLEALCGASAMKTTPEGSETPPQASTGRETASCVTITDYYNRKTGHHVASVCKTADGTILWAEGRTPIKDVVFLDPPDQNTQPGRNTE